MFNQFNQLITAIFKDQEDTLTSLKQYVKTILEETNNHKVILMHRRWLIVFEILSYSFFGKHVDQLPQILCDSDCHTLNSEDHVLISDDIIIHGRTVMKLFEQLKQRGISSNVTAFYRHVHANRLDVDSFIGFNGYCVTERDWHDLSNKLIQLILRSKIPYTTFTYSFAVTDGEIYRQMDSYKVEQPLFKIYNMHLNVFFEPGENFTLFKTLKCSPFIRHYTYDNNLEENNISVFIPFVLIPSVDCRLFSVLAQNASFPKSVQECFKSDEYSNEYKARLLSFVLSYAYGKVALNIKSVDEVRTAMIKSIISKSFSSSFEDVINLNREECNDILRAEIAVDSNPEDDNINITEDTRNYFCDFLNDCNTIPSGSIGDTLILESTRYLHDENEKLAQKQENPLWGYKVSDFHKIASTRGLDTYKFWAYLYSVWDTGKGSYYFREYNGTSYGCCTDGEQAYRIDYQNYGIFSDAFFKLRDISRHKGIELAILWNAFCEYILDKSVKLLPKECIYDAKRIYSFLANKTRSDFAGMNDLFDYELKETLDSEVNEFLQGILQKRI